MTHRQLVRFAGIWLRNAGRCPVVFTECRTGGTESPDALGFKHGGKYTVLVECKASRADFLADRRKWFRRPGYGVGCERWYMAPPGIIRPDVDLVDGWGLLEVVPSASGRRARVRVVVRAAPRRVAEHELLNERATLWSFVRLAQMAACGRGIMGDSPRVRQIRDAVAVMEGTTAPPAALPSPPAPPRRARAIVIGHRSPYGTRRGVA